jgi:hypothetical protein
MMEKPVYIGNPQTKEFHSIKRQKPDCNVKRIKKAVAFKRGRDAVAAGYDACGHCALHWKSRR